MGGLENRGAVAFLTRRALREGPLEVRAPQFAVQAFSKLKVRLSHLGRGQEDVGGFKVALPGRGPSCWHIWWGDAGDERRGVCYGAPSGVSAGDGDGYNLHKSTEFNWSACLDSPPGTNGSPSSASFGKPTPPRVTDPPP